MSWTDERVEILKKMWGEGQSASQIAKELGGVTRNAVIGKVHRLGLSNRATSNSSIQHAQNVGAWSHCRWGRFGRSVQDGPHGCHLTHKVGRIMAL